MNYVFKRLAVLLLALVFTLCCVVANGQAESGKVDIFFTGNTLGKYHPCKSCGRYGLGGLSRRSYAFGELRKAAGAEKLFVAGGYEFTPFREAPQEVGVAVALGKAYTLLNYDAGLLSVKDAAWLETAGAELPDTWRTAGTIPQVQVLTRGGKRFGLVFFPATGEPYGVPDASVLEKTFSVIKVLRPKVDMVVGVSAWGARGEMEFLQRYVGSVDLLLGSGPGMGFGPRMVPGGTLWIRPEFEGRSIVRIMLETEAFEDDEVVWKDGDTYAVQSIVLDDDVPFDAKMTGVFAWF